MLTLFSGRGIIILAILVLAYSPVAIAWDGRWTDASSGQYPVPDGSDRKNSHSDSGLEKDRAQHYFIPPNPQFDDVDPDELSDNVDHDISPYAMVRLTRDINLYGKQKIIKGYYLVKIGQWGDGSVRQKQLLSKEGAQEPTASGPEAPQTKKKMFRKQEPPQPSYNVLIFKQSGKVLGIVPIDSREIIALPDKQMKKLPKTPLAWVEANPNQPHEPVTLKFYYRHMLYIARLG